jgi:putative hydrolase of the HAD superfamily
VELKTAIVTSIAKFKYKEDLKLIIRRIDLLVDSHTFRCEKSNPKIYMKTVEKLNVKPRQAVMIGDDVRLDVELPKKLGMKAILLDRRGTFISEGTFKPDFIVGNLTQAAEKIISGYL